MDFPDLSHRSQEGATSPVSEFQILFSTPFIEHQSTKQASGHEIWAQSTLGHQITSWMVATSAGSSVDCRKVDFQVANISPGKSNKYKAL